MIPLTSKLLALLLTATPAVAPSGSAREPGHHVYSVLYSGYFPQDYWDEVIHLASAFQFELITCDAEKALLDKAAAAGVRCIVGLGLSKRVADDPKGWEAFLEKSRSRVEQLRNHPAVFAWYPVDQPDWQKIPPTQAMALASIIRGLDRTHPIFTTLFEPDRWSEYFDTADIIGVTPYLLRRSAISSDSPEKVTETIRRMRADLQSHHASKPVWAILGAFELKSKRADVTPAPYHKPTPSEWDQMVALALAERVDGIAVFVARLDDRNYSWTLTSDPPLWESVRQLPKRLSQ